MCRSLCVVAVVAGSLGFAATACQTAPQPMPSEPGIGTTTKTRAGETIDDVAKRTGVSVVELMEVNAIGSHAPLPPGTLLFIPAGAARPREQIPAPAETPAPPPSITPAVPSGGGGGAATKSPAHLFVWPVDGVVVRSFVGGKSPHEGLLFAAPLASPVRSTARGRVAFAGSQGTALGQFVVVEHDGGFVSVYAHLNDVAVHAGQDVAQGAIVGSVGRSAITKVAREAPQLFFQLRKERIPIDPEPLLEDEP